MIQIEPVRTLRGEVQIPGDKSISHRYAMLAAMAQGVTRIANFSASRDCQATLNCVGALGVEVKQSQTTVEISSAGWDNFMQPDRVLDVENSGTTIRLLSSLLACREFVSSIQGDESLNRRPMGRIMNPLTLMGAEIEAREGQYPPLTIRGSRLQGIRYSLPVASAQVKSCVLLAGLTARERTTVVELTPSRDHTERALPFFGARLEQRQDGDDGRREISVSGPTELRATSMEIPADFSSAVYFILGAVLAPGSDVVLRNVGVNPTRTGFLSLLEESGSQIAKSNSREANGEPICDLRIGSTDSVWERFPKEIRGSWIPNLIDEIPALAVLGVRLKQGLIVRDAQELRKKESDRIQAVVSNLRQLGVEAEELPDGLVVPPKQRVRGGKVETFGDHRIAMAFALAALIADAPVELDHPECVDVSFPGFFDRFRSLCS